MYSQHKRSIRNTSAQPIIAAKRRRKLYPFAFQMGPVALCITSVCLMGLMAVLYLSQVGQAVAVNQQIQDLHTQQATLQRQNQDLLDQIAHERSPEYIADNARKQGLMPVDPKNIQIIVVPNLQPMPTTGPTFSP